MSARRPGGWRRHAIRAGGTAVAGLALLAAGSALSSLPRQEGFPHAEHAGLFPTCLGCHRGIPTGDSSRYYTVTPENCSGCHDGSRLERIEWREPTPRISNLDFSHAEHGREVEEGGDAALECATCHRTPAGEARLDVAAARPEACIACHAHAADAHLASEADCATCHRPLAAAQELPASRIAGFPEPPGHDDADFLAIHGERARSDLTSCTVCHARETCTRCHLNAARLPVVQRLPPDPRVASLEADRPGEWPEPASHDRADWDVVHGREARASIETCSNCHAAESCTACHGEAGAPLAADLPHPGAGEPSGVRIERVRPPGHTPDFATEHGTAAAVQLPTCSTCHVDAECATCHDRAVSEAAAPPSPTDAGPGTVRLAAASRPYGGGVEGEVSARHGRRPEPARPPEVEADTVERDSASADRAATGASREEPGTGTGARDAGRARPLIQRDPGSDDGFHPMDFVVRHGAEAFAARSECSECHSGEAFCRSCHQSLGMGATSRQTTGAFHDAEPDWLIAHGRAARQGLEACASCHRQSSCLRCHSARSGLRISPHGPGFDPDRVADRSLMSCAICHAAAQILP